MINLYVPKLIRRVLFDQVMVSVHEGTTFLPHFFFLYFTWFLFFSLYLFFFAKNKCKIDLIVKLSSVQWKLRKIRVFFDLIFVFRYSALLLCCCYPQYIVATQKLLCNCIKSEAQRWERKANDDRYTWQCVPRWLH